MLFALLSSMDTPSKFKYIDKVLHADPWWNFVLWFVGPLATAAAVIYVYPFPAKWVYEFTSKKQNELRKVKQEAEDERPMTRDEERTLRRQMVDLQAEFETRIRQSTEEAGRLREIITKEQLLKENAQNELQNERTRNPTTTKDGKPLNWTGQSKRC